jgi:AraC-like DNA-binding protein
MLLAARIDIAKRMIASTDKSITEIGFDCGFSATSAFIQSFKRMTGKTPLSYRKSYLENK